MFLLDQIRNNKGLALIEGGLELSYEQLIHFVDEIAITLKDEGVKARRIYLIQMENHIETIVLYLALHKLDAVPFISVTKNYVKHPALSGCIQLGEEGYAFTLLNKSIFVDLYKSKLVLPDDAFGVLTSSRSGKLIINSKKGVQQNIQSNIDALDIKQNHVTMAGLPLSYSYGLIAQVLSHLCVGAQVLITNPNVFPLHFLKVLSQRKISSCFTVPIVFRQIVHLAKKRQALNTETLKYISVGGSFIEYEIFQKARALFNCPIIRTYGIAEAGPRIGTASDQQTAYYELLPHVNMKVLGEGKEELTIGKVGRLTFHSSCNMIGYINDDKVDLLITEDLITEDIGYQISPNSFSVLGRKDEFIEWKGQKIWFSELMNVIARSYNFAKARLISFSNYEEKKVLILAPIRRKQTLDCDEILNYLCSFYDEGLRSVLEVQVKKANELVGLK